MHLSLNFVQIVEHTEHDTALKSMVSGKRNVHEMNCPSSLLTADPKAALHYTAQRILEVLPRELFYRKKVLIKPNWVNSAPSSSGVTVNVDLIGELARNIKEAGAIKVSVGEAALLNTQKVFNALKVRDKIQNYADILDLSQEDNRITIPLGHPKIPYARIPKVVHEFDTLLSVAKLKTHCQTRVSFTVKNLFALFSQSNRRAAHTIDLEGSIASLYLYLQGKMDVAGILDGTIALDGPNGPLQGKAVPLNIFIAGEHAIDVDQLGCQCIGCPVDSVSHLVKIRDRLDGESRKPALRAIPGEYKIRPFDLPPPGGWRGPLNLSPLFKILFRKKPWWKSQDKCTLCGDCSAICPTNSIAIDNERIIIDKKECIECLCCTESCGYGAMSYQVRNGWLYFIAKKTYKLLRH